jgi:hypothetical protein
VFAPSRRVSRDVEPDLTADHVVTGRVCPRQ